MQKVLNHCTLLYCIWEQYWTIYKKNTTPRQGPLANLFLIQEYSICVPLFIFGFTRNTKSILWRKLQFLLLKTLKQQSTFFVLWDIKNKLLSVEVLGLRFFFFNSFNKGPVLTHSAARCRDPITAQLVVVSFGFSGFWFIFDCAIS